LHSDIFFMPETTHILSIDVGTSSVRAIVYDAVGRATDAAVRTPCEMDTTQDGGVCIDADRLTEIVSTTLDRLFEMSVPRISAVGVCTFWHNVVGVGMDGIAVTPLISWADTRPGGVIPELKSLLDETETHARTGCMIHPSYLPAKLLWLSRTHPEAFCKAERWMSFGEYLFLRYFGHTACSLSMASGTGLLDVGRCRWDEKTLSVLPVREHQLSPISDARFVGLSDSFAARWLVLRDIPWFPAVGDGVCSNVGSGCVNPDRLALMVGTSGAMRVMGDTPSSIPHGLWCYRADGRRTLLGGALSNGGNVYAWMRETLRLGIQTDIERALGAGEPDGHGLTVLPFWAGERSPRWHAAARATITGMTLHTRPEDLLRATLEATSYCFESIYKRLETVYPDIHRIVASGGGLLESPAWMQMMADVIGRPVTASSALEASSRGAALLAGEAMGALSDLADAPIAIGATYEPDARRHARYKEAMARQQTLYDTLIV